MSARTRKLDEQDHKIQLLNELDAGHIFSNKAVVRSVNKRLDVGELGLDSSLLAGTFESKAPNCVDSTAFGRIFAVFALDKYPEGIRQSLLSGRIFCGPESVEPAAVAAKIYRLLDHILFTNYRCSRFHEPWPLRRPGKYPPRLRAYEVKTRHTIQSKNTDD
ncbi:hypothetical protein P153DRAFT_392716 [Dothidotthia symphoricarpi CBS 119687]|uniref:Uncharacterized protein n=1 Tax=Dothidotthia symphoricarpi CBS 119687 TaxID=1392245 RepID=A0A6A6ATC8_9PLEO|nr:uncharacterized protein P153DRAFT_392716 [Dothidotthia symphoricarpi CBS 119687]KAF2134107.1 hypothetical protein P153DRAFT_392716 [Dothidotthia symphoricarpi CBS 119687]